MDYDAMPTGPDRNRSQWPKIVACLIGLCVTLGLLYCIFYRPDIYVDMMQHLENRDAYAKEAEGAKAKAASLEKQVGELKAQLADSDSFAQSLHANLQSAEEQQEAIRSQVEAKDAELAAVKSQVTELQGKLDTVTADRDALASDLDEYDVALARRWHLSLGGYVSHPFSLVDGINPSITGLVGVGRGHVQLLAGAGVDLDGVVSISVGTMWTW